MYPKIEAYIQEVINQFDSISTERKSLLQKLSLYIQNKSDSKQDILLNYICTHNSRRSHFGQIWAKVAADFYSIKNVSTFSGGTETTAFNKNAIEALTRAGFYIHQMDETSNPKYNVYHASTLFSCCFSKVFDHIDNPKKNFAAIMTCSDAEENCPFIPGVDLRLGTTYDDPKAFDNTEFQDAKYDERCKQIAIETFYTFSLIQK